jgi:hypothetical protein
VTPTREDKAAHPRGAAVTGDAQCRQAQSRDCGHHVVTGSMVGSAGLGTSVSGEKGKWAIGLWAGPILIFFQ